MAAIHKTLAAGRWQELTLAEQLGNIGSEVGRAIGAQKRGDDVQRDRAIDRALELFDLTLADARWRHRLKEIARAREVVCDFFHGGNTYRTRAEDMEKYFTDFAMQARKNR